MDQLELKYKTASSRRSVPSQSVSLGRWQFKLVDSLYIVTLYPMSFSIWNISRLACGFLDLYWILKIGVHVMGIIIVHLIQERVEAS